MSRFALLLLLIMALPLSEAQDTGAISTIGYASIEEAYAALQVDPEASLTEYEGWTIFKQKENGIYILWSFTPEDHPTHPTVIRREIAKHDGEVFIKMDALCYSSKMDCDQLVDEFRKINERIKQNFAG